MEALTMADGTENTMIELFFLITPSTSVITNEIHAATTTTPSTAPNSFFSFWCCVLSVADEQISVKVNQSGWAWMVCGDRLIIWKICQTAVAKVSYQ